MEDFLSTLGAWKHKLLQTGYKVQVFENDTITIPSSSCKLDKRQFVKTVTVYRHALAFDNFAFLVIFIRFDKVVLYFSKTQGKNYSFFST